MTGKVYNLRLHIVLILIASCMHLFNIYPAKALEKDLYLEDLIKDCITFNERDTCLEAIIKLEALQLDQASKENYSCQTRLLGLQAHLIISADELLDRALKSFEMDKLKENCGNF